jgi:anti-sigma regulatory factor (Ser/Thr protein kinase)
MQAAGSKSQTRVLGIGTDSLRNLLSCDTGACPWRLDLAPDLDSGREKLRSTAYDVVLVELSERAENEMAVVQQLRDLCPSVDVILLVDESTPQNVIDAMRSNAFAYFSKPFDSRAVRETILSAAMVSEQPESIRILSASVDYLSLNVRCSISTADRLVQFMSEMPIGLSDVDRNELGTAFREMLLNAIEHGAKLDPEQWIRVSRIRTARTLVYHIQDPGGGFSRARLDHAAVAHPADPIAHVMVRQEAGMRAGGFGMLIASSLVDEVIYNEQGNEVILIKYLD